MGCLEIINSKISETHKNFELRIALRIFSHSCSIDMHGYKFLLLCMWKIILVPKRRGNYSEI